MNSGQTCIAPDYAYIPEDKLELFIKYYKKTLEKFYSSVNNNTDCTAIINEKYFLRLSNYIEEVKQQKAKIITLFPNAHKPKFSHSIFIEPSNELKVMKEEIFFM